MTTESSGYVLGWGSLALLTAGVAQGKTAVGWRGFF